MKKILLTYIILLSFLPGIAQEPVFLPEGVVIHINERQIKVKELLRKIESQTPYLFLYNETQLDVNRRISCKIQSGNIYEVLNYLSEQLGVRYEIMDIQILLLPPDATGSSRFTSPVTGRVIDEDGHPMEDVSIFDELSGKGTLTGENGSFHLYTGVDSCRLRISYLGYETYFTGQLKIPYHVEVKLTPAIYRLQDVVAVGYGTLTRRELSSAVGYVSSQEFLQGKINNPIMGVKGLISGVSISGSSLSDINSNPDVQIRGAGSILAGNNPLIVVDGIPGVSLNSLSISDIESVSILKDGSSAAIYGSNGANGVILITTKTGKAGGKLQTSYNTYIALSGVSGKPSLLSPEEFLLRGRDINLRSRTDWFKEITRTAPFEHYHDFSIRNGWEGGSLRFSGNFRDGEGLDIASSRKEYALRSFVQQSLLSGHLDITASLAYKKQLKQIGNHEAFQQALTANPTAPVYRYESTGEYYYPTGFSMDNPVALLREERHEQENQYITGSVTARVNLRNGLYAQVVLAENREELEESAYWTSKSKESVDNNRKGRAERIEAKQVHRMVEWTNHYDASLNGHNWKGLLGYSWQRWDNSSMEVGNADFPTDFFTWNNLGTGSYLEEGKASLSSSRNMSKLISIFARVNYSYKDLIMCSASLRREGSSKFGSNHKWGNFPALSAGVRVTEFTFFHSPEWLDDLKLRTGYGISGRHQLSPYQSLETYSGAGLFFSDGKWIQVFGPGNNPNPDLRWEKSLHTNVGTEAVLFKSSLVISLDYYRRTTKDLLFEYNSIKPPMIHDKIVTNIGVIDSDGLEWEIVWRPIRREGLHFTTILTGNYNRSRLRSLSDQQFSLGYTYLYELPAPGLPGPAIRLEEGKAIGSFYGFRYAGVDQEGNILIRNKAGERVSASERVEEDKAYIGNGVPKVQLAWSNTLKWGNVNMRLFFTSWLGYDLLNLKQLYYGLQNQPVINVLQDAYTRNEQIKGEKIYCDYFLEKGNFLKLEEVSIGYKFPLKKNQWIENVEGYLAVNNVCTFTKYTGTDPSNININGVEPGIESLSVYPVTRTFTLGLSVRF